MLSALNFNGAHDHGIDNREDYQVYNYISYLESHDHRVLLQKFLPYLQGEAIFDVGCGTAAFFEEIQKAHYPAQKLIGIESSQILTNKAREKDIAHAEVICASIDAYKLPKDQFDTVTLLSVFHELFSYYTRGKLIEIMDSLSSSLHKGGSLLIYDGFQYEERQAILEIQSQKRRELFKRYLTESGYEEAFVPMGNQVICPVSRALDFIHKSTYAESWEHELPEQYYPLSLSSYYLLLGALGFRITAVKEFPELDRIEELSREIQLYDSEGKDLLDIPCNCLIVAEKI